MTTRIKARFVYGELTVEEGAKNASIDVMQRYIADVGKRARDLSPIFYQWQDVLFDQEQDIFDSEGIPKWPQLVQSYADWKTSVYGDQPILQATGRLMRSLTSHTSDTILRVSPRRMEFGTKVPHSGPLQSGTYSDNGSARPHLYMSGENFQAMSEAALQYIAGGGGMRQ